VAAQFGLVPLPPPTWSADGELSLVATGGSTSTRTIGLGGTVVHRGDRTTTRGAVAFVTSESDAVTQARAMTAQGRHGIRLSERLEVFGQGLYTRDLFAGIEHRAVADGGLAYTTRLGLPHSLIVEGGVGYTVEQRLDTTELRFLTGTGTIRYRWRVRPGMDLTEDVALIANVEDAPNWRGTSATALTVALNQLLSLRASHVIEYRNAPVAGFGRTDWRTAAALVISLERRP
jgi:putative salt-induced outer membrane protein YdiY